jgi:Domain of unknown function (DUF1918)
MAAKPGDRVILTAKTKRVRPAQRAGVIEDVLDAGSRPRYSVRWDDGRTTVIAPVPGTVQIEAAKAKPAAKRSTSKKPAAKKTKKS